MEKKETKLCKSLDVNDIEECRFDEIYEAWLNEISFSIKTPETFCPAKSDFNNPSKHFSYADYKKTPESNRHMELHNGILKLFATPFTVHAHIKMSLVYLLQNVVEDKEVKCEIYCAPFDIRLPLLGSNADDKIYDVVQPDICVICDLSKLDDRGCIGAPDLIVEVLSPSTLKNDWNYKFNLYEAAGVREYWIVDPKAKMITVFLLQPDGKYDFGTIYECNQKAPVHIFEGLEIDLNELFE